MKIMFDQQHQTSSSGQLNTQNLDITSNNDKPNSPKYCFFLAPSAFKDR